MSVNHVSVRGCKFLFCFFGLWLTASTSVAQEPACDQLAHEEGVNPTIPEFRCLPESLPAEWKKQRDYLSYHSPLTGNQFLPIVAGPIYVNGEKDGEDRFTPKLFKEDHWVWIPPGRQIFETQVMLEGKATRIWDYPTGTRVIHQIDWNEERGRQVYEVRLVERLPSGIWAYGAYIPSRFNAQGELTELSLRKDRRAAGPREGASFVDGVVEEREITVRVEPGPPQNYHLKYTRVPTNDCRDCHYFHGGSEVPTAGLGQPENLRSSYAGPCGFSPINTHLQPWIDRFKEIRGYAPIVFKSK